MDSIAEEMGCEQVSGGSVRVVASIGSLLQKRGREPARADVMSEEIVFHCVSGCGDVVGDVPSRMWQAAKASWSLTSRTKTSSLPYEHERSAVS